MFLLERDLFIAIAFAAMVSVMGGCDSRKVCRITYANHSGNWITGAVTVDNYITDGFERMPFTELNVSMHPRYSSGTKYEIKGRDIFSGEEIIVEGYTPKLPSGFDKPNLVVEYLDEGKVRTQWVDDSRFFTVDRIKDIILRNKAVIPVLCRSQANFTEVRVSVRQRPELFATKWGKYADVSDRSLPYLYALSEMVDPRRSPELVLFFWGEDKQGEIVTWRDVVDGRQVVGAPEEGAMFWIEIGKEGEYRLGWGQSNERDLRQLRRLLNENALAEPVQWWTGQAKKHPELPVYSLYRKQTINFPDLRFDDEIQKQQGRGG